MDMCQQLQEIGLLIFFYCTLIRSFDEFLSPLIRMWRVDESAFSIEGVMLQLEQHDIHFLTGLPIHGILEVTHPTLVEG